MRQSVPLPDPGQPVPQALAGYDCFLSDTTNQSRRPQSTLRSCCSWWRCTFSRIAEKTGERWGGSKFRVEVPDSAAYAGICSLHRSLTFKMRLNQNPPLPQMLLLLLLCLALGALLYAAAKRSASRSSKCPISVNYHFTRQCNKSCGFCFHTATTSHKEQTPQAKRRASPTQKSWYAENQLRWRRAVPTPEVPG